MTGVQTCALPISGWHLHQRINIEIGRRQHAERGGGGLEGHGQVLGDAGRRDRALEHLYGREYKGRGLRDDGGRGPGSLDASLPSGALPSRSPTQPLGTSNKALFGIAGVALAGLLGVFVYTRSTSAPAVVRPLAPVRGAIPPSSGTARIASDSWAQELAAPAQASAAPRLPKRECGPVSGWL